MDDILPTIEGTPPRIECFRSGLYTLDFLPSVPGRLGIPLRSIHELYGREHSGKTSLASYLVSKVKAEGRIAFLDFEYCADPDWLQRATRSAGFTGTIYFVADRDPKGKLRPHAEMADEACDLLLQDEYSGVILDSLGMWVPRVEAESKIGESNMGKRAHEVGQWSRRTLSRLRAADEPKAVFAVNHMLDQMSTRGHYTPGGRAKAHAAATQMWIYRKDSDYPDGCFQAEVRLEKNRYGGVVRERRAQVFIIPELGVSPEMTAVIDCFKLGLASRDGGWVKCNDVNLGRISELIQASRDRDTERFGEVFRAIERYHSSLDYI